MNRITANKYGYLFLKAATGELTLIRASKISAFVEDGDLTAIYVDGDEAFFAQESLGTIFEQLDDICPNML